MGRSQMTNPTELYACLYVKEFPAQANLRLRPELHSMACVVMEGEPPSQSVCSLNTKARLLHLSHGMTRVEVDTFSNPVVLSRSRETEMATKAIPCSNARARFHRELKTEAWIRSFCAGSTSAALKVCLGRRRCWRGVFSLASARSGLLPALL